MSQPVQPVVDILVVDDTPANLMAIEALLRGDGHRLVMAASGAEALKLVLEQDFALILLDVQMPEMDGFQTARMIRTRKRSAHIPIIFITAYGDDDSQIERAYELGAVDFLFKPIVPGILRAKVQVFVELALRTLEVGRQAEELRDAERARLERRLEQKRREWENEQLRTRVEAETRAAEEAQERAEELARILEDKERAETQLSRTNARLARADERKNVFIATLAHELRNPLATLVYGVEVVRGEDGASAAAWASMARQLAHLKRLVDDLLDVSRVTSGKISLTKEPVDLRVLVEQSVETSLGGIEEKGHDLQVELPSEPVVVMGDQVRLVQVISNLLNNAARYTPEGGHIRVEVAVDEAADEVEVRVVDDGRGVDVAMLEDIFEVFVQGEAGAGGLGVGLALVKRLTEEHDGSVKVVSGGVGQGATFIIRLPIEREQALPMPEDGETDHGASDLRIVVIDDEEDLRETLVMLLEMWGFQVASAPDGPQGIELVTRTRPDLVFSDIGMPGMDGYEVARRIVEAMGEDRPRLVATTGYGREDDRRRCLDAGFDEHLTKPVSPEELRAALITAGGPSTAEND